MAVTPMRSRLALRWPGFVRRERASMDRRRPLRDNTQLLVLAITVLLALLAGLLVLAGRSSRLAPDFLTEVVLYALTATNITMLLVLLFVLARHIVKLVVERRRALPFARFRAKLVAVLMGMTLIPAVLVLLVGSELIRTSVDRWFNAPMEDVLASANAIAGDYYQERQALVTQHARQLASSWSGVDVGGLRPDTIRAAALAQTAPGRVRLIEVYTTAGAPGGLTRVGTGATGRMPRSYPSGDRLAQRALREGEVQALEPVAGGGELIRTAVPLRGGQGAVRGVMVVSELLSGDLAVRARRMTRAYEDYQQLRVLKQPLATVYLSFFLMLSLLILMAATWMGMYLAKRITKPVQMLAAATKEIGAGHFEHRLVPETSDEFRTLIEGFNSMAAELAASRRRLERTAADLARKNDDVEARRRYIETILERIATGVVSIDRDGRLVTVNPAAVRLLGVAGEVQGLPASAILGAPELEPLAKLADQAARSRREVQPQEVSIVRDGQELQLAVVTTPLQRQDGVSEGVVLVFEDVTPLIRAQKVAAWREVARRLAHEIKNPLTPIQLCAERLRRQLGSIGGSAQSLVDECTTTIVGEVESLKGLVDEFAQFARMPAPRAVPTDVHRLIDEALALYDGLFTEVRIARQFAPALPVVPVDREQIRRVVINVIDNAIEAMEQRGTIAVVTEHDPANRLVRIIVADQGPGIPAGEREKLFLPYYSTKGRGSGLGLAIVRRIVIEHGGSIEVSDNSPTGTKFVIELPCAA